MTTKFNNREYRFGDSVKILGHVKRIRDPKDSDMRRVRRFDYAEGKCLRGKIAGIGRILVGRIERNYEGDDYYYPNSSIEIREFAVDEVVLVWKVQTVMMHNPILCRSDQIAPLNEDFDIPVGFSPKWPEQAKQEMKQIVADMPRDDKGRWIKSKMPTNV